MKKRTPIKRINKKTRLTRTIIFFFITQNTPTTVFTYYIKYFFSKIYAHLMKTQFVCSNCGYQSPSWYGKCPECQNWNTFQTKQDESKQSKSILAPVNFVAFNKLSSTTTERKETGTFEFDRVLGGGFIVGETVLLAGEPGVGKS